MCKNYPLNSSIRLWLRRFCERMPTCAPSHLLAAQRKGADTTSKKAISAQKNYDKVKIIRIIDDLR